MKNDPDLDDQKSADRDWEKEQYDPYTDDEKDQMGSSEYFSDND
jgi:hypothetical protein